MKNKTLRSYHLTLIKVATIKKKTRKLQVLAKCGEIETLCIVGGDAK